MLVEAATDYGIVVLDPAGHIRSWNPGAEHMTGYASSEVIGRHFSLFYAPEAVDQGVPDRLLESAALKGRIEDEGWRIRKDGSRFRVNAIVTALRAANGEIVGFSKITRDVTRRYEYEEMLRQSEERFRLLVSSVREYAIFLLDRHGHVSSWNPGAERIFGYTEGEIVEQHFSCLFPPEDVARGKPELELERALRYGSTTDEGWRTRKDGSRFWADVVLTVLRERDGSVRGFAKITRDLSERKQIEALEESNRHTNEFLAMLSHELRNPLAPLRNAADILRSSGLQTEKLQWARDVIDRQVTQLARLVDDLLDVSRITRGRIVILKELVDLEAVIASAAESVRPLIDAKGQSFEISPFTETLQVEGDFARLVQVVTNLLNNASKYTPRGGRISLNTLRNGHEAQIHVRDNGSGIAPDLLPRIFELFAQGQRTLDRSDGGLGIGLTLVRQIVSLHGGVVQALSAGCGQGSEFIVRLPLATARPGQHAPSASVQTAQASDSPSSSSPPSSSPPASSSGPDRTGGGSAGEVHRRVLVVDDNQDAAQSTAMLLELFGHEVRCAHDGPTALAVAEDFRPDAILLDIGLPGMNGYEVAEQLRRTPSTRGTLLIAVTGYGQPEDRSRARAAGFDHHVVKPVEPETLQALLR